MRPLISPSLMCMDFLDAGRQLEIMNRRVDMYHIDIMDGHFVSNLTLSPCVAQSLAPACEHPMDFHIVVTDPELYIEPCKEAAASLTERGIISYYTPHCETINGIGFSIIDRIRDAGFKVGVAVNPETPLSAVMPYLHKVDLLTIMSVDPGFSGHPFIPEVLDKVVEAKRIKEENPDKYHFILQMDGACNARNFKAMCKAGAEALAIGNTGLFGLDKDIEKALDEMEEQLNAAADL